MQHEKAKFGPGGIMRTLREFPKILAPCRDIEDLCPDAWVINYINPPAANGIGLRLYAPKLKSFALCDGLHMPHIKKRYAVRAGIIQDAADWTEAVDKAFDFRIAGPNPFTWLVKAAYDGKDVARYDELRSEALTRWREAASRLNVEEDRLLAVISDAFPTRERLERHFAFDIRTFQIAMPEALPTRQLVDIGTRREIVEARRQAAISAKAEIERSCREFVADTGLNTRKGGTYLFPRSVFECRRRRRKDGDPS